MKPGEWTTEEPMREGDYWLYGDFCYGSMGGHYTGSIPPDKELHFVRVVKISNGHIAVCNGQFMSLQPFDKEKRREGWVGVWQPVVLPVLPTT